MDADEFFAEQWLRMVPILKAALARAGAPVADREDLVQETAIRLLGMWDSVDWSRSVEALARTIALNLWRDQWRKTGRRELIGEVVEQAAPSDTERAALARVQIGEVSRALSALPSTTASVLRLAAAEAESGVFHGVASGALRMARTRARRALLACAQVASAIVVGMWAARRSVTRAVTPAVALGAMAAIACLLALVVPPGQAGLSVDETARAAAPHAAPAPAAVAAAGGRAGSAPVHRVRRHPAASPTPYYVVGAGPASVGAFLDVDAYGKGGQVRDPRSGSSVPVCVYGGSPGSVVPAC